MCTPEMGSVGPLESDLVHVTAPFCIYTPSATLPLMLGWRVRAECQANLEFALWFIARMFTETLGRK